MSPSSTYIRTDVTAVTVYRNLVLAGIGSSVYVYLPNCTKPVQRLVCLNGQKIYGFRRQHIDECHLIVFGGKQFTIILGPDLGHDCPVVFTRLFEPVVCDDWLHSVLWTPGDENMISVLTAHNVVQTYNATSPVALVCQHNSKDNSILYSGLLLGLESAVLVMAGTVYSEVIIHVCGEDKPLHRLKGHKGVIFSISCNPEKNIIVTTSDDRSLRIWGPNCTPVAPCNSIEYWKHEIVCKYELYGHHARVMRSSITDKHIISVGEDSKLCFWFHNGVLDKKVDRHQNAGIWSIDTNGPYLLTGGGDGGVTVQSYSAINNYSQSEAIDIGIGRPKHISYSAAHNLFILTETNRLIYYDTKERVESDATMSFDSNKTYHTLSVSPSRAICAVAGRKSFIQLAFEIKESYNNQFTVEFLTIKLRDQTILSVHWAGNAHIVACTEGGSITVFIVNQNAANSYAEYANFELPTCKERWLTCAAMEDKGQVFIFGDRCGGLHLYKTGSKHPLKSFGKLHGRYGPTSITIKSDQVITTGRDKTIKYFSLSGDELTHTRTKELSFHWVEGFLDVDCKIVCGFNDKKFVVFDLSVNENVLEVACGGGHRSWDALYRHNETIAQLVLKFIYLKNSRINTESMILSPPVSLKKGSHSKEINCLRSHLIDGKTLFLSGGEDTTVRVSSLDNEMDFEDLVICKHLSSVRTLKVFTEGEENLVITAGGRAQICIKLFKFIRTNGRIEVNTCDLVDYMLKGTDKERKNYNWKSDSKDLEPETRIMDVDYIRNKDYFTIFTGCSDARVRVFVYKRDKSFKLINESKHLETCILKTTCISFMQRDILITCSTRGEVAFWDASDVDKGDIFEAFFVTRTNKSGINSFVTANLPDNKILIASGGDDNALHINVLTVPDCFDLTSMQVLHSLVLDKYHSSAITGLCLVGDFVLSTSIDQRITLYRLKVTDRIECDFVYQTFSDVADIKGLDVITQNTSSVTICVFGKGIEVFNIPTSLT